MIHLLIGFSLVPLYVGTSWNKTWWVPFIERHRLQYRIWNQAVVEEECSCDSLPIWFTHSISLLPLLTFTPEDMATWQWDSVLPKRLFIPEWDSCLPYFSWCMSNILRLMLESSHYIIQPLGQGNKVSSDICFTVKQGIGSDIIKHFFLPQLFLSGWIVNRNHGIMFCVLVWKLLHFHFRVRAWL